MEKDAAIIELLDWLRERLGNSFTVTDHWQVDQCAVGISTLTDPAQLVYVLSYGGPEGRYSVHLESAPQHGSEMPYQTVGKFDSVSREELLGIVTNHLGISK
jgi:hypothetical protein